jgi:hypothetical protein
LWAVGRMQNASLSMGKHKSGKVEWKSCTLLKSKLRVKHWISESK